MEKITVKAIISANLRKVWDFYTDPKYIIHWNFASEDWCCPTAKNDLKVGGTYRARMESKDGSMGFDFEAVYSELTPLKSFSYGFEDREVQVLFSEIDNKTQVIIHLDPESENPIDMQRDGWQAILNNFKKYTESN